MSHDGPRFAFPTLGPAIKLLLIANAAVFVLNAVLMGRLSDSSDGGSGLWFAFSCSGVLDGFAQRPAFGGNGALPVGQAGQYGGQMNGQRHASSLTMDG